MSGLKEFLVKHRREVSPSYQASKGQTVIRYVSVEDLGLFFWERGGKQFAYDNLFIISNSKELKDWILDAKEDIFNQTSDALNARDFLDALDCLGKEKIKELIKEKAVKEK